MNNGLSAGDLEYKKQLRSKDQKWLENRLRITDAILALSNGVDIETTFDAEIILCCVISALAATIWPGERIDKARYTQTLVDYCPLFPSPKTISIGALLNSREGTPEGQQIQDTLWKFDSNRVVQASEVDVDETVVIKAVPSLSMASIRKHSYAHIIYSDIRSGLIHEYGLSKRVTDWSVRNRNSLHYSNVDDKPRLFVPYEYVKQVVRSTSESVFDLWRQRSTFNQDLPQPATWWIDG